MPKILIVDDTRQMADSLKQMISLFDIEVTVAYGPRPAMQALQTLTPDLIFMDLNMPGLGGFDVIEYCKREPRLAEVPIVVVTSDDQPETRQKAKDLGASGFIVKPAEFDAIEGILTMHQLINNE